MIQQACGWGDIKQQNCPVRVPVSKGVKLLLVCGIGVPQRRKRENGSKDSRLCNAFSPKRQCLYQHALIFDWPQSGQAVWLGKGCRSLPAEPFYSIHLLLSILCCSTTWPPEAGEEFLLSCLCSGWGGNCFSLPPYHWDTGKENMWVQEEHLCCWKWPKTLSIRIEFSPMWTHN